MRILSSFIISILITLNAGFAAAATSGLPEALKNSDDIEMYLDDFIKASEILIARRICTVEDFDYAGGWAKATGVNQNRPVYFTYCGGFSIPYRWYLNVKSGATYQ